jgi:hypothetical protein
MSLILSASFIAKQNSLVPLAQNSSKNGVALRVASTASDLLGVLTASGAASSNVSWSLSQNPSWVTLSVDSTTLIATLMFSNAQGQANPYQFIVTATDGLTTVNYAIFLDVKDPFTIASTTGSTSFSIPSYDSTVPDIVFQGVGLNGVIEPGVQFITPSVLPPGMKFITSNGSSMLLRVDEPSDTNVSGGLALFAGSPASLQITLQAYLPGSMYDSPDRCFTQEITIESLTAKQGTVDLGVSLTYNTSLNAFSLVSYLDFLGGEAVSVTYEWDVTGTATGNISSGGTANDTTLVWVPATAGNVGFTVKVKNATSGVIIGEAIIAPAINSSGAGIPCSNVSTWNSTDAVKISFSSPEARGFTGDQPTVTISTPAAELNEGETITVAVAVSSGSNLEGNATLSTASVTLNAATPVATVALTLPESGFNQKWIISASASNAASNPTRTGYAQTVVLSNGDQPIIVTATGGPNFTSNIGQSIALTPLLAATQLAAPVVGAVFSLEGAPAGLYVDPLGNMTGNALKPGTYTFEIVAEATGFARSYSSTITLVASAFIPPLIITDAVPSVASLPDGQQFTVSWGYSGTPLTLNMLQGFTVRSVLGSTQTSTSQVGSSVITIYGTSFYGDAYSIPALVLSSSITALGNLPDSPTVGTLDEQFNLTLQWNPLTINGNYQAYKAWNIYLSQPPNGAPQLQSINGSLPTGLEDSGSTVDSRLYEKVLSSGDWQVTMQALTANAAIAANSLGWDSPHEFPTSITAASITFDNATVSLGQTVTITLDPNYIGADTWQAIYPDGTTSGWMPISSKTLAKVMNLAGNQSIVIQTLRNYSKSNPPVKLIRQVTKPIYVMNQQFIPATASNDLTGNLGIGGESGFEITDASSSAVALQPYEVVVRALVRDTVSNELKIMVATSRTSDASSLLGTLAIDVFPIQGRPRVKDLIDPSLYLSAEMGTAGNPVRIGTTVLPNIIVGKPMADFPLQVGVNSGVAPFSWYADNLPFGIKLSTNGTLTGTAMTIGTTSCDFSVVDSNVPPFIAHITLPVIVESDLKITTTSLPQAVVGTPYNIQIVNSGGIPPYTWSLVAGSLPVGLSIDPLTGIIVGTPVTYNSTTDFNKVFTFTVEVVDAIGALASAVLSCTLAAAPLQFGPIDQPEIFATEDFELTIPIFGGSAPYTLTALSDDGTIGTGLQVANPGPITALAGVVPPVLAISTTDQALFPQSYPIETSTVLQATGGVAPYKFSLLSSGYSSAIVWQELLAYNLLADGTYTARVQVTDRVGATATKTITFVSQRKNSGTFTPGPVQVNLNGSNNPVNWTITPIAALPDATNAQPYNAGSGTYYGIAIYKDGALHLTQTSGTTPMNFTVTKGALPTGIVAFSGNSFDQTTDYSGIVLFNVSGGQNATVNGSYSFEFEFSNIVTDGGTVTQAVDRYSITVTTAGGGATPVVVVTSTEAYNIDLSQSLSTLQGSGILPWAYPLNAEGGSKTYSWNLLGGTTLPAAQVALYNESVLTSYTQTTGTFVVIVSATDTNGVTSAPTSITLNIIDTPSQPVHIVGSTLPTYLYANRPIPAGAYFIESDIQANWGAAGLPAGVSLTTVAGTRAYLQGTPTSSGNFAVTVTAISTSSSLTATTNVSFQVRPQTASFLNPPTSATVGTNYRVINNNAILQVQYTGYQPTDSDLPLLTSQKGTVGAPGITSGGSPTTGVSSLTTDGFILSFDYLDNVFGSDVITLGANLASLSLPVNYPAIVATSKTVAVTVSEYSTTASLAPPVSILGGLAPYTITLTGFSDPRFTALGGQISVTVDTLPTGQTTGCQVSMLIVDSSGNSTTATGTVQVTVRQETFITVNFSNAVWSAPVTTGAPFTTTLIPNQSQSVPVLGHAPYQFYIDSVTLPGALTGFVQVSPSKRVLAINCNSSSASASIFDVDQSLNSSGNFIVAAVAPGSAPAAGSYSIQASLRVVDADALVSSQTVTITLVVS